MSPRLRVKGGGVPIPTTGEKLSTLPTLWSEPIFCCWQGHHSHHHGAAYNLGGHYPHYYPPPAPPTGPPSAPPPQTTPTDKNNPGLYPTLPVGYPLLHPR